MGIVALAVLTASLALNGGQWAVGSGLCVAAVTLPAAAAERVSAGEPQVKLDEQPADPAKEKAAAVSRARALLAQRLGVEPGGITLESASPATWPDAALGCPEKDRMYAQVVTSGYKVVFEVDGKKHEVHVAGSRAVVCPAPPAK